MVHTVYLLVAPWHPACRLQEGPESQFKDQGLS